MIRLGPEVCRNFKAALQREWLETRATVEDVFDLAPAARGSRRAAAHISG